MKKSILLFTALVILNSHIQFAAIPELEKQFDITQSNVFKQTEVSKVQLCKSSLPTTEEEIKLPAASSGVLIFPKDF